MLVRMNDSFIIEMHRNDVWRDVWKLSKRITVRIIMFLN